MGLPLKQSHIVSCLFDWCAWLNTKHFKYDTFKTDPKCGSTYDLHLNKWLFHSSGFSEKKKKCFGLAFHFYLHYVLNNVGFIFKIYPKSDNFSSVPIITTIKQSLQHELDGSLLASPPAFILTSIRSILNKGYRIIFICQISSVLCSVICNEICFSEQKIQILP